MSKQQLPGGDLPPRLRHDLNNPPRAGDGVHRWLFTMALKLHRHCSPKEIEKLLAVAVKDCGREVPPKEISDAVVNSKSPTRRSAIGGGVKRAAAGKRHPKWPLEDKAKRAEVVAQHPFALACLQHDSPLLINGDSPNANWFLEALFTRDHLLCLGLDKRTFATHPRDTFATVKLEKSCLIVPSPMTTKYGRTQQGKRSEHTLSNTGPRRYLVTEFDSGTKDEQAAIIQHLRGFAPLVMVLFSGGKSLHAWWRCKGADEGKLLRFFHYAVSLGADKKIWTRSQFVRLPQGWRRDKETLQQVYYFDPAELPAAEDVEGEEGAS